MTTLEQRIQDIENRQALNDVLTNYIVELDSLNNADDIVRYFTDNVSYDLSGINYPKLKGKTALLEFFNEVIKTMSHNAHYATNFKIDLLSENVAKARAHIIGMGYSKENQRVQFHVQYQLGYQRISTEWLINEFSVIPLMPFD
ncbi:nuclear transport factor 2 family protein [Zhongshania sp. BJYM1]|jgi:hypothetical protein|uniref:nuclear transport factor 2 family protein n=1 Tax=Zhongshania aquatica TaxID=2965069 RepID=UPI0022B54FF9|nr:nuclear transport factor 2 family protein [Marortus sp. BJYM1]